MKNWVGPGYEARPVGDNSKPLSACNQVQCCKLFAHLELEQAILTFPPYTLFYTISFESLASFPGAEEGGERAPGTHCLRMCLIAVATVFVCARTFTRDIINSLCCCVDSCAHWCSVRVRFILHCSMPSGSWIPRDKAQERTGCLQ